MTSKLDTLINDLVPDLKPIVEKIEGSTKTTQDHYGRYMDILTQLGHDDKVTTSVVALALIKAGANRPGVRSALKILY